MIAAAEELGESVGVSKACRVLTVPRSRLYRERRPKRPPAPRPTSKRALSREEKAEVHQTLNSERFQDCPPREVYATLLDKGIYLCDWRTMYRILGEYGEVQERRNQLQHPVYSKPELLATAPNQVWSWDITKLRGPFPWICYYLYVILDIFSRYVVGWMIAERESGDLAKELIMATCAKEEITADQLALHADRGSPMKSKSVGQLLTDLEVAKSFSRPHTPDDNPYSEAQFKTMKYRPDYPDRFESQAHARGWARDFIHWYNHEHYHNGLALMTPAMVHHGLAEAVYTHRQRVLQAAYEAHPERFVRGMPTPPALPKEVWINQPQSGTVELHNPAAVPAPDRTQPGAQAVSRVAEGQAGVVLHARSLDTGEHLATVGKALEQLNRTESFDTNISLELSQNA
jgi:putative transposase